MARGAQAAAVGRGASAGWPRGPGNPQPERLLPGPDAAAGAPELEAGREVARARPVRGSAGAGRPERCPRGAAESRPPDRSSRLGPRARAALSARVCREWGGGGVSPPSASPVPPRRAGTPGRAPGRAGGAWKLTCNAVQLRGVSRVEALGGGISG